MPGVRATRRMQRVARTNTVTKKTSKPRSTRRRNVAATPKTLPNPTVGALGVPFGTIQALNAFMAGVPKGAFSGPKMR